MEEEAKKVTREVCGMFGIEFPIYNRTVLELWSIARNLHQIACLSTTTDQSNRFQCASIFFFKEATSRNQDDLTPQSHSKLLAEATVSSSMIPKLFPTESGETKRDSTICSICQSCKQMILSDLIEALGMSWHCCCFKLAHICAHCGKTVALSPENEFVIVGSCVVHQWCSAPFSSGRFPSHQISVGEGLMIAEISVTSGLNVHIGGELKVKVEIIQQRNDQNKHWWNISTTPIALTCKLICKEYRRERVYNYSRYRKATRVIIATTVPHLLGNVTETFISVPTTINPSVGGDRAFSREYELSVSLHFKGMFRPKSQVSFDVVVCSV